MEAIIEFGHVYLQEDVVMLLFVHGSTKLKNSLHTYEERRVVISKYLENGGV